MNIKILHSWLSEFLQTDAKPKDIAKALSLCSASVEKVDQVGKDFLYTVEVTTNRVDMFSVYGIAREAAAILPRFGFKAKLNKLDIPTIQKPNKKLPLKIIDKGKLCNRILAVVFDEVKIGPSPKFIEERLETSEIRSLNNLIDITNYVMLEVGHPVHVFDYDRIKTNKLILRKAKLNESIVTLDDKKYRLNHEDVIIDDGTGRIIDLPGIMGLKNSVVVPKTKRIVFFIEGNDPVNIRRTSMRLGIRTLAATINEKNPDPELAMTAFLKGIKLYQEITHAKAASRIIDIYPNRKKPKKLVVSIDFINKKLGISLDRDEIIKILRSLSFDVTTEEKSLLNVTPPSFRQSDVAIQEDIVEEVARIFGYHNLPSILPEGQTPNIAFDWEFFWETRIKQALKYWGFTETYTYSLISKNLLSKGGSKPKETLKLQNPLTEENEFLRSTLLPSLLEVVAANQSKEEKSFLFELSMTYKKQREGLLPDEKPQLAIIILGGKYLDIKGYVEQLFVEIGRRDLEIKTTADEKIPVFFDRVKSTILKDNIGYFGEIAKPILESFGIRDNVSACELDCEKLFSSAATNRTYTPPSKFPPVIEDLTFEKNKIDVFAVDIVKTIRAFNKLIVNVKITTVYKNTLTFRIRYQSYTETLTNDKIEGLRREIVKILENKYQLTLKGSVSE